MQYLSWDKSVKLRRVGIHIFIHLHSYFYSVTMSVFMSVFIHLHSDFHDFEAMCHKLKPTSKLVLIDMGASLDFVG